MQDSWIEQLAQICALQGFVVFQHGDVWRFGRGDIVIHAFEPETDADRVRLVRTLIGAGLIFPSDN